MERVYNCSVDTELLEGMRLAKQAISRNQLVVIPTDTVYGLAADAFSAMAVRNLLDAKGRGRQSPPPVLIPNQAAMIALTESVPELAQKLADAFWPGALTMILRSQPSLDWDLGETKGTVALRMPDQKYALALLNETGPLAVSSANLTAQPAATSVAKAYEYFGSNVAVYLDGGESPKGEPSTILDLTGEKVRVIRLGALSVASISEVVGPENIEA